MEEQVKSKPTVDDELAAVVKPSADESSTDSADSDSDVGSSPSASPQTSLRHYVDHNGLPYATRLPRHERRRIQLQVRKNRKLALTVNNVVKVVEEVRWLTLCDDVLRVPSSKEREIENECSTDKDRKTSAVKWWIMNDPLASWRRITDQLYGWGAREDTIADKIRHYCEDVTDLSLTLENLNKVLTTVSTDKLPDYLMIPYSMERTITYQYCDEEEQRQQHLKYFINLSPYGTWSYLISRLHFKEETRAEALAKAFVKSASEPTLTINNLNNVMESVQDMGDVAIWLGIPLSKQSEIKLTLPNVADRRRGLSTYYVTHHPAPSWLHVADAMWLWKQDTALFKVNGLYLRESLKPFSSHHNEFTLPDLRTDKGYEYVARSPLALVQLPNTLSDNVSIQSVNDLSVRPSLNSNEILITPIFHFRPQDASFHLHEPAILELMKSIVPTDQNPNRQLLPLYSSGTDPLQWKEVFSHECEMLEDRVRFKTTEFGYVCVKVRFPFPSASITVDPTLQREEKVEIKALPGFKMEIPPVSVDSSTTITTTVLYQDPQVSEHFKDASLASACIKLEPHNTQFQNKVKITLPIPNYSKITQKYPDAKLQVWHAKSTDDGVPMEWEPQSFTIDYDEQGNCLATAYITHFSLTAAIWSGCKRLLTVTGLLNFFVSSVRGRCQVFMTDERKLGSVLTFGVAVLFPWSHSEVPNYPHCLFDSVDPIEITAGDVECQIDVDDVILQTFSSANKQKSYTETAPISDSMRADFVINLHQGTGRDDCELPAGPLATLLIKHGSEGGKPYKYNLVKPSPTSTSSAIPTPPDKRTSSTQVASHPITKAAQKLSKATRQLKQNVLVHSAGRIAKHMQKVAKMASCESGSAHGNIADTMKLIFKECKEIERLSRQVAKACTEPGLKQNVLVEVDKISATATQLKILSSNCSNVETSLDPEAVDLLTTNATNLMSYTEAALKAAERAILKVPQSEMERLKIVPERTSDSLCASKKPRLHELDLLKGNGKTIKVINRTASSWERVALRLHFEGHEIKGMAKDNHYQTEDACRDMFSEWLLGKGREPRTWTTVITALEEADLSEVASDLKQVLGIL